MVGIKHFIIVLFVLIGGNISAQVTSGRIVFERKTNLVKMYKGSPMESRFKDAKSKIDMFELYFDDTSCVFQPIVSDEVDEMQWATSRNTVYQNIKTKERMSIMDMWGNKIYISDSISARQWKITDSKRFIGGYECTKAIWQKDDSTRIYAWFSPEIVPPIGPEMFAGLPGAILGLATEDGGIIYFAKEVEILEVPKDKLTCDVGKNKVMTVDELKSELGKRFGNQPWGKRMIDSLFRWF